MRDHVHCLREMVFSSAATKESVEHLVGNQMLCTWLNSVGLGLTVLMAVVGVVAFYRLMQQQRLRLSQQMRRLSAELGLRFQETPSPEWNARLASHLQLGRDQYDLLSVCQGQLAGREAVGGVRWGRNQDSLPPQVLLLFPDAGRNMPEFTLMPENVMSRAFEFIAGTDLDFTGSPAAEKFSRRYYLRGPDESSVRALFDESLVEYLSETRGWEISNRGGHLCFAQSPCVPWRPAYPRRLQSWREWLNADYLFGADGHTKRVWLTAGQLVNHLLDGASPPK
jgi:hypothetical protein